MRKVSPTKVSVARISAGTAHTSAKSLGLTNTQKIDNEHESSTREVVASAGLAIGEGWWANERAATADLHAWNTLLPALDEAVEWELDWLTATPRRVELFASFVVNTEVVNLDDSAYWSFDAGAFVHLLDG